MIRRTHDEPGKPPHEKPAICEECGEYEHDCTCADEAYDLAGDR